MEAVTVGANADALSVTIAAYGATIVHQAHHTALVDFGPEAWGESVAQIVRNISPQVVIGCGTERGHEVIAQVAARLDLPASPLSMLSWTHQCCTRSFVTESSGLLVSHLPQRQLLSVVDAVLDRQKHLALSRNWPGYWAASSAAHAL